ncbi:MAG TPA: cytochrome P450 [Steroidobacteraceae bacterium]|nr:cytochrome P450 [Steroidobacteraceae bacterium]
MGQAIPDYKVDLFSHESVRNARAVDDTLREFSPVVRLADGTVMITRHADVIAGLGDWQTYSSKSRPWHDPKSLRPEILLTDDPPVHTRARQAMAKVLSTQVLAGLRPALERDAAALVDDLLMRQGEILDGVREITQRFVYKALPDAIGLRVEGREHMYAFSHMVWATMGPENALFHEAMVNIEPVLAWLEQCCDRNRLAPGGIGPALYRLADEQVITLAEAKLLLQTVLAAGADTTILTLANAMQAFALFPEEYQKVRADPNLVRAAFDESLRWDSPSRMAGRITARAVDIDGYTVPAGQRVGLMFAAANRDPRAWPDPDRYDIGRDLRNQVGWGYGVHACVGRVLAQMEAHALLSELARRVARIEMAGAPEPWMTTIGHGPAKLPIRLYGH